MKNGWGRKTIIREKSLEVISALEYNYYDFTVTDDAKETILMSYEGKEVT